MISKILSFFRKDQYVYGDIMEPIKGKKDGEHRINKKTGDLEFVLWKAGEQGHKEDFWHRMGSGWINYFVPHKGDRND